MKHQLNFFIEKNLLNIIKIGWVLVFFLLFIEVRAADVPVSLTVDQWEITHGVASAWLDLGLISVGDTIELSAQFAGPFWVSDLKSSDSWYRTTVRCSGLRWPNWSVITGIYLKNWNSTPTLLDGMAGNVKINPNLSDFFPINTSVNYIYREQGLNYWTINKYWDNPWIKIVVPAYMQPWSYSWEVIFDFHDGR